MVEQSIKRLEYLTDIIPSLINAMGEESFSLKISKDQWSKKEIIGHLIDSATNNHQRFVRGQFEITPEISYNQNKWNECSFYQQINSEQIISFWTIYNKQLLEIIKRIPIDNLKREIKIGGNIFTLKFLIADYVEHLEHHLKQIVEYE